MRPHSPPGLRAWRTSTTSTAGFASSTIRARSSCCAPAAPRGPPGPCRRSPPPQAGRRAGAGGRALEGDAFLHLDARGDNACIRDGHAILVDWNWAGIGNGLVDVGGGVAGLRLEGGPEPWSVVDDSRGLAALFAGFFLALAPLPPPETAPRVREFQLRQGGVALGWAARELGLDPPTLSV